MIGQIDVSVEPSALPLQEPQSDALGYDAIKAAIMEDGHITKLPMLLTRDGTCVKIVHSGSPLLTGGKHFTVISWYSGFIYTVHKNGACGAYPHNLDIVAIA